MDVQLFWKTRSSSNAKQGVPRGNNLPELGDGGQMDKALTFQISGQPVSFRVVPCLGWAAECVACMAETKVLCRCCPLRTQPQVRGGRWGGTTVGPRLCPLWLLPSPQGPERFLVGAQCTLGGGKKKMRV